MTFTIPGEEPVGYTYRAENHAATLEFVLDVFVARGHTPIDSINAYRDACFTPEDLLRALAKAEGIEYDDPRSYDTDVFPKPIYADQLSCSDSEWTELAPSHTFEFIPRNDGARHCVLCGGAE